MYQNLNIENVTALKVILHHRPMYSAAKIKLLQPKAFQIIM